MENIYLDKTIFRILGGKVETVKKTKNRPMKLIDSISSVQDGQVY
jgi:DNA-binding CsgD family transcriptional regulator